MFKIRILAVATILLVNWPVVESPRRGVQLLIPQSCLDSFNRDVPITPPASSVDVSFQWDTTKCPNMSYRLTAQARDQAQNVGTSSSTVVVINEIRLPMINMRSPLKLYPTAGYLELLVRDQKRRQFGLSTDTERFAYSIVISFGKMYVIENFEIRVTLPAVNGTLVRVMVRDGVVTYLRNGQEVYRSLRPMTDKMAIDMALEDADTTPGLLTIAGGSM
jgi:hypothetical protein